MPGARMLLEELIALKEAEGEVELAQELKRIANRISWSPCEPIPLEVDAIFAAHYAARPSSRIIHGKISRDRIH